MRDYSTYPNIISATSSSAHIGVVVNQKGVESNGQTILRGCKASNLCMTTGISTKSSNVAANETEGKEEQGKQTTPSFKRRSITTTCISGQQQQTILSQTYNVNNGIDKTYRTSIGFDRSTVAHKHADNHNSLDIRSHSTSASVFTSSSTYGYSQQTLPHSQSQPVTTITTHHNHQISDNSVIINTISGSIPATGFPNSDHRRTSSSMINRRDAGDGGESEGEGHADDVDVHVCRGSISAIDLNSCTDLSPFPILANLNHNYRVAGALESNREKAVVAAATRESLQHYDLRRGRHFNTVNRERSNTGGYLWIVTPVAASVSVAIVIAALAGPQWLYTEEKLPNVNFNGTTNWIKGSLDDSAFITKYTKSSLWIICTALQGMETYNCIKIDYFPKEGYQPDPLDSTPAIPYTVTKSCPYFLASGIFLLISFIVFLIPTCSHQNNLYYFSAGIMFIVSGLLMLIGLIAYISILKAEIGSKLRPRSTLQPALFKVTYGQSFFLFVFGFISTEVVGVLNIFLYISLQEAGYYSKIKEGENPRSQIFKHYQLPTTPRLNAIPLNRSSQRQIHQKEVIYTQFPAFSCKKHSNALSTNEFDHRVFLGKAPKCNLHPKSLAKSLNELYTEPAPPLAPPPPQATTLFSRFTVNVSAATPQGSQTLPRPTTQFANLPQEFPLTRSVSTTTELFSNGIANGSCSNRINNNNGCRNDGNHKVSTAAMSPFDQKNRQNKATNTLRSSDNEIGDLVVIEEKTPNGRVSQSHNDDDGNDTNADTYDEEPRQRLCGLRRGARARRPKDELFNEFCQRAGMRPKPKNIYYIEDNGGENLEEDEREISERRLYRDDVAIGNYLDRNRTAFVGNDREGYVENEDDIIGVGNDPTHHQQQKYYSQVEFSNQRRRSMHDPESLNPRKLNSNLSLHSLYALSEKNYQKGLFGLERSGSSTEIYHPEWHYDNRPSHVGNQSRFQHPNYYNTLHQSRTLPRSFLKRNCDSQDSLNHESNHLLAAHMLQQQHQHQHQKQLQQHYLSVSRNPNQGVFQPGWPTQHKSCDDLLSAYHHPSFDGYHKRQTIHLPIQAGSNNLTSRQEGPVAIHWPAAIPSSPSNFNAKSYMYTDHTAAAAAATVAASQQMHTASHLQQHHSIVARSNNDGGGEVRTSAASTAIPYRFQRDYIFDEQRRTSAALDEIAFDLDEIERERRRSHASLFDIGLGRRNTYSGHYDIINGTAV